MAIFSFFFLHLLVSIVLWERAFSSSTYLFTYLFISVWTHELLFYLKGIIHCYHCLFWSFYYPNIVLGVPAICFLCFFKTSSCHLWSTSIFSGTTRCSRLIFFFTCPSPVISHFLQGPLVPLVENGIQKPRSGLCVHWLLLAYHFSQALSVNQTKKYMYVCIHIYIYIYVFTDWKPWVHTNTSHSSSAPQGSFQSPLPLHICISLPHQRESCLPLASTCQFLCSISICNKSPNPQRASQKTASWGRQPLLAACCTLQHPPCGPTVTLLPSSSIYLSHATIFLWETLHCHSLNT